VDRTERTTEPAAAPRDELKEAAEHLAATGRRHEAIALVERVFREQRDIDTGLLLTLLLLGSDREEDLRLARAYLRRLGWQRRLGEQPARRD